MTETAPADTESETAPDTEPPRPSAPENISVSLQGFDTEEHARTFGNLVATYVRALSHHIDISALDGITIAADYAQALLELDRGYETNHKLTPSEGIALGVAMTPAVIRDGKVKSHILFNALVLLPLEDDKNEFFEQALHTLAHECAHVEVTERFNAAFPGILLQSKSPNLHAHCRSEIIKACWDEYAVTQLCAPFGQRPTDGYEETFIAALNQTRPQANGCIKAYRLHGDLDRVIAEVYGAYGDLMKFACYHLGNLAGLGLTLDDVPKTAAALSGNWFAPFFDQIKQACGDIAAQYGEWTDRSTFEALGDVIDEIVADGGMTISNHRDDGSFHVDIPFSPQTMPDPW